MEVECLLQGLVRCGGGRGIIMGFAYDAIATASSAVVGATAAAAFVVDAGEHGSFCLARVISSRWCTKMLAGLLSFLVAEPCRGLAYRSR